MTDVVSSVWRGRNFWTIVALGSAQTIAWASSYYLPAILATPIARDLGVSPTFIYGALSVGLVIAGLLGPRVGHFIDTFGGRELLAVSNLVLAAGLVLLSFAHGAVVLIASWFILGVGMGMGLYEAAFATLTRIYGYAARKPITGITLIAGFASTVGWPITAYLDARYDWRVACQVWAFIHLALALPMNLSLPRAEPLKAHVDEEQSSAPLTQQSETKAMIIVAYVFAATGFVSSGLSALMPSLLIQFGATPAAALLAGTLIGPAQVTARIIEAGWLSRYHPLASTRLATVMNPLGVAILAIGGPALSPIFAVFYGAGNGVLTIARGTLPLALFGPRGFGRRVGMLSLPARATGAVAPLAVGLLAEHLGAGALWATALASVSAFIALLFLRARQAP
jgi:predicted MFS family arabinose efflux permease